MNAQVPNQVAGNTKAPGERMTEVQQQKEICPGVYANPKGTCRLVIAVMRRRIVFSWDDESAPTIRLTSASARTFTSPGRSLVRAFTTDEVASLLAKAVALRPRRRCNRFEKQLFYGRIPSRAELPSGDPTPESACVRPIATSCKRVRQRLKELLSKSSASEQQAILRPIAPAEAILGNTTPR